MKIGIYGGTFDPPHLGHMAAAKGAIEGLGLDKLIFMPTRVPPHKEASHTSAGPEARWEMVSLMADGMGLGEEKVSVSRIELEREGKSYTADTLAALREEYPEDELWLLMGTDMFLSFQNWSRPEEIVRMAGLCAFTRWEGDSDEAMAAQANNLRDSFGAQIVLIHLPELTQVSSTQVRDDVAGHRDKLWCQVYGYILKNKLYGTNADLKHLDYEDLRAVSYAMVKAKRIPHIRGTEETAATLANRWGADEDYARRAAILHDCTKYLEMEEQQAICRRYGMELDELERVAVKLLHSKTGAALAGDLFGQPQEVVDAIYCHTTGKADMTTLEKIIYLADYMEPNRAFEGVEEMRKLAFEDLDRAVLMGCEMSVEEMRQRNKTLHPNTQAALDWLKGTME